MSVESEQLEGMLQEAVEAAREAGALLRERFGRVAGYELKTGHQDLVTSADAEAEAVIVQRLKRAFPEHAILSEEMAFAARQRGEPLPPPEGFRWAVDPLDGTTNFAHGVPFFAVSIALERDGEPLVAAIYEPLRDELFTAVRGGGAALNGRPLRVSGVAELRRALLGTGFPTRSPLRERNLEYMARFLPKAQSLRRFGAAALGFAYVACGRLEAYWELTLNRWDCAAGVLLVEEAGGRVSRLDGGPVGPDDHEIVASNGHLHDALLDVFAK